MNNNNFQQNFRIVHKIGEGAFSTVYLAEREEGRGKVAIKKITRTTASGRIANELKILMSLQGMKNVIEIIDIYREGKEICIAFPYIEMTDFKEMIIKSTISDIKYYMFELLTAIQGVHSQNIIHRDIKPSNFLYNLQTKTGCLIDFGLSQRIEKKEGGEDAKEESAKRRMFFFSSHICGQNKPVMPKAPGYIVRDTRPTMTASRSGTRGFKAPEVLFRVEAQSTAIDIWSAGVILLSLLCRKYPFFTSKDDINTLVEIGSIFGDEEMRKAAKFYKRIWKSNIEACMHPAVSFQKIVEIANKKDAQFPSSVFDLLEKMLRLNSSERITADEALRHKFFSD
ncbi:cell division control protein 7 [Nematocida parisii]|nr:cell division control protein 7 [Nematocida parisii]KAI5126442.1 cell division control protein 7 [Nematocida parisii]KAI5140733.1 cell division control protein 7 [Nematocida parisii]KAI5156052.1 cell division control protein 7 [Nematocida parisii]